MNQFSSVAQSCPTLCDPMSAACQASLAITNSQSSLKLTSIESVMPSRHLILCCPLLLLPSIFHSIRVFSNELAVRIRWPKYWRLSIKKRLLRCKTGNWELAYPLFHCHSLHCKWSLWYPLPLQLISTISLLRTFQLFSFLSLFLFSWPVYLIILDFPFTDINQDAFSFL